MSRQLPVEPRAQSRDSSYPNPARSSTRILELLIGPEARSTTTSWTGPTVAPARTARPLAMATAFLRNLVLRPAVRPPPAMPTLAPIAARAFSTTPSPNATLNQVLRVRSPTVTPAPPRPPVSPREEKSMLTTALRIRHNRDAANSSARATPSPRRSRPSARPRSRACA